MQFNIKSTNIELTANLKDYIEKKINMLERFLGKFKPIKCEVEIEKTTNHHEKGQIYRAEVNLAVPGELLRIEKTGTDIFKAIDKVKDHLDIIIKKYKEKKISKNRIKSI